MEEFATAIAGSITDKQVKEWTRTDPIAWANESHALAVEVVYADVAVEGPPVKIGEPYLRTAEPVIELQLAGAGVRLAELLNRIFR